LLLLIHGRKFIKDSHNKVILLFRDGKINGRKQITRFHLLTYALESTIQLADFLLGIKSFKQIFYDFLFRLPLIPVGFANVVQINKKQDANY
jgi:hypothetical protein